MEPCLISRPFRESNVGSNLSSLAGAAWVAKQVSRPLVVDWRGLSQLTDPAVNYFSEFFERPSQLLGVPVFCTPDVEYDPAVAHELTPGEARTLACGDRPPPAGHIVLQPYHGLDRVHPGPDAERHRVLRTFYRQIRPTAPISTQINRWWEDEFGGAIVVGVNVRTGNGHYFGKGQQYAGRVDIRIFQNERRFLRVIDRAVRERVSRVPKPIREGFRVFYATDAAFMSEFLAQLPGAATRRRRFPPDGAGDTYAFGGDAGRESIVETISDMFLLARCDAFVYNSSLFNQYARVLTGSFGGNQVHIESLFLRTRMHALRSRVRLRRH